MLNSNRDNTSAKQTVVKGTLSQGGMCACVYGHVSFPFWSRTDKSYGYESMVFQIMTGPPLEDIR